MKLKSLLLVGFVIGIIVVLSLSGVFALTNKSKNESRNESRLVGNDSDEHGCKASAGYSWCGEREKCIRVWEENCTAKNNTNKNMTFGKCVSDSAKTKNDCYSQVKDQAKYCLQTAKNQTAQKDKRASARQCDSDYKTSLKTCKEGFKSAKTDCMKIKHGFFERMRAAFA
jgi:hypothetical protein